MVQNCKNTLLTVLASFGLFGLANCIPMPDADDMVPVPCVRDVIYEQPLSTTGATFSNQEGQIVADQFELPAGQAVSHVVWYGFYGTDLPAGVETLDFLIAVHQDSSGVPATDPLTSRVVAAQVRNSGMVVEDPNGPADGLTIYEFQATLPFALPVIATQTVWISIAEADPSTPALGDTQWLWSSASSGPDDGIATFSSNSGWHVLAPLNSTLAMAFQVSGECHP